MVVNYIIGFLLSTMAFFVINFFYKLNLKLFLVSNDQYLSGESVIPIVGSEKARSILKNNWGEDIELILTDYDGRPYKLNIHFGLLKCYFIKNESDIGNVSINNMLIKKGVIYNIRNGSRIKVGNRTFIARVTYKKLGTSNAYSA